MESLSSMRSVLLWTLVLASVTGCGWFGLEPRVPRPGTFHFTVATYNLNNDDAANPHTLDAIGLVGADIICFQEITGLWQASIESRYADAYRYRLFKIDEG